LLALQSALPISLADGECSTWTTNLPSAVLENL
jgi:hypothetical protein